MTLKCFYGTFSGENITHTEIVAKLAAYIVS